MKNFLDYTTRFFFILFISISLLVFLHEPPTGPEDEPYIEYANFQANWGKTILILWGGSLIATCVGVMLIKPKS